MKEIMSLVGQIGVAGTFTVLFLKFTLELVKFLNNKKNGGRSKTSDQPAAANLDLHDIKEKIVSFCERPACINDPQVKQSLVNLAVLTNDLAHLEEALREGLGQVAGSNRKQTEALSELRIALAPLPGAIANLTLELRNGRCAPK